MMLTMALALVVSVGALPSAPASADEPITVGLIGCWLSGPRDVAGGAPIVLGTGWIAQTRGHVQLFRHGHELELLRNGVPVTDADDLRYWSEPTRVAFAYEQAAADYAPLLVVDRVPGDEWQTLWRYPTTAPAAGSSVTYDFVLRPTHPILDLVLFDGHRPYLLKEDIVSGSCVIRGT